MGNFFHHQNNGNFWSFFHHRDNGKGLNQIVEPIWGTSPPYKCIHPVFWNADIGVDRRWLSPCIVKVHGYFFRGPEGMDSDIAGTFMLIQPIYKNQYRQLKPILVFGKSVRQRMTFSFPV